jgi:hypothetical protein
MDLAEKIQSLMQSEKVVELEDTTIHETAAVA